MHRAVPIPKKAANPSVASLGRMVAVRRQRRRRGRWPPVRSRGRAQATLNYVREGKDVACPGLAGLGHGAKPLNRGAARLSGKQGWQWTHKPRQPSVPATCLCGRALPRPLHGRPHYGRRRLLFALPSRDFVLPAVQLPKLSRCAWRTRFFCLRALPVPFAAPPACG